MKNWRRSDEKLTNFISHCNFRPHCHFERYCHSQLEEACLEELGIQKKTGSPMLCIEDDNFIQFTQSNKR